MSVGGGDNPPAINTGGGGDDDQQIRLVGTDLVLEDGGPPIDFSNLINEPITDVFGNPI